MSQTQIYTGPWINFEKGWILGSTLTLSSRDASLLTAFLAAFITIVGSQGWRLLSFIIHQLRSSKKAQDGLHHQHQLVFRNTGSPWDAAKTFTQQWWAWRGRSRRPFLRSIPWMLLAITYILVFATLSIFSGEVTKASGSHRLIIPNNCGYFRLDSATSAASQNAEVWKTLNDSITAAAYARQCYGGNSDPLQCGTMKVPSISSRSNPNATCPFESGLCIWGDTAAFSVESKLIDSRDDLGINAPDSDRVQLKKVTTCAPLHTTDYATVTNDTEYASYDLTYYYGEVPEVSNYTYMYNTIAAISNEPYSVTALYSLAQTASDAWTPVDALNRTDADVTILFIAPNSIYYSAPNNDPIFGAHAIKNNLTANGIELTFYDSDRYVNTMACSEQYQFCEPNSGACTELSGSEPLLDNAVYGPISFNTVQQGVMGRIWTAIVPANLYNTVSPRGSAALRAQELVSHLEQGALPDNEWQLEVESWFEVGLAQIQQRVLEYASGPQNVIDGAYIWQPTDVVSRAMCHTQLVRSTNETTSFSVLGVSIILLVGALIILLALTIEPLTAFAQKHLFKNAKFRHLNWVLDDKFQLQRMMYEAVEMGGTWEGTTDSVPVTEKGPGLTFGGWEGIDEDHPSVVLNWRNGMVLGQNTPTTTDNKQDQFVGEQESKYRPHGMVQEMSAEPERENLMDGQRH